MQKKSTDINDKLTNRHLAASEEEYCQETRRIIKLADRKDYLECDERKKKKQCVAVGLVKNKKIKTVNPNLVILNLLLICAHMKKNFNFSIKIDLTDKNYVFDEPNIKQLDHIVEEVISDCMQIFHGFK